MGDISNGQDPQALSPQAMGALIERVRHHLPTGEAATRRQMAHAVGLALEEMLGAKQAQLTLAEQRRLVEHLSQEMSNEGATVKTGRPGEQSAQALENAANEARQRQVERIEATKRKVLPLLLERMDISVAARLSASELEAQIKAGLADLLTEHKLQLNAGEQVLLVRMLVDDLIGLGPLEPLLADESVTDIMVNGPKQIYIERRGKLTLTDASFRDNEHVMNVATRIVTRIGRRVDESSPLVDARLADGSRVNIIIPPLAIDGPSISIRKFAKREITLDTMVRQGNISEPLAAVLKIASRSRLNVIISGGTGSGKTTLLNALSRLIDHGERVVTIEDAAELRLQQPHVVRLETRPASLEGAGEITMRDLVKNALRMRPDRIILGEVRGAEAVDMLQAMNTGHDGSMCTLHANTPREALTRMENMVAMSSMKLPTMAVRMQIASAVQMIVQISRMRDGVRRITQVSEIVGMEGDVIVMQDLFTYQFQGERADGSLIGKHICSQFRPHFTARAEYYGLKDPLLEAMQCRPTN